MQKLLEAANDLSEEIMRTRKRLSELETALSGLQPLIAIETTTITVGFTPMPASQPIQDVSDVKLPDPVTPPKKKKPKAKTKVKAETAQQTSASAEQSKKVDLPTTSSEFWLSCLGRRKMSIDMLTDAAMSKLEVDASGRKLIRMRVYAWLGANTKQGKLTMTVSASGVNQYQAVRAPG